MEDWPILSLVTFLPLVGALFILGIRGEPDVVARNARYVALWTSLATFVMSLFIWFNFERGTAELQFVEQATWFPGYNIDYKMGVDGISMLFVMLSTLLTPICVVASWDAIKVRVKEYMIAFLVLETLMVGMFCAQDFVLFYFFYEGVLIPMFLIIGIWGGERRVYSAFKFFLFTLAGSVLLFLALLAMYFEVGTTDIQTMMAYDFPASMQTWLWLAMFASFAVKVPMWPVHTWLPDAHVEAPTAGSVILAGVLLKMGGYGFIRFSLPMLPLASEFFTPLIFTLSIMAIIYTTLVALAQEDMKKLIAYSSVAHIDRIPRGYHADGRQYGREHDEQHGDTVDAHLVVDVVTGEPGGLLDELEFCGAALETEPNEKRHHEGRERRPERDIARIAGHDIGFAPDPQDEEGADQRQERN